jgi:hypothetical protein
MKVTNVNQLPEQLVNVVQSNYKPTPHQYSCTTILKPTRQIILERKYTDILEQDVSDMCWLIFGIAVHSIIENAQEGAEQFKEEYLKEDLGKFNKELEGYKLSGRSDLIDLGKKKIVDWKTCSVWKVLFGDFEDWRKETLIYAWLVRQLGFEIEEAEIVAFIKDHKKSEAKIKKDYPPFPIYTVKFTFTEDDYKEIEEFIINKFLEIKKYEEANDFDLPLCTPEERYNTGDKWAIKKKGNKVATKVHDNLESARNHLINLEIKYPNTYEIEERKGLDKKCLDGYCSCCKFCPYYLLNYDEDIRDIHFELAKESEVNNEF